MAYQKKCYRSTSSKTNRHQLRTPPDGMSSARKTPVRKLPAASKEAQELLEKSFEQFKKFRGVPIKQ